MDFFITYHPKPENANRNTAHASPLHELARMPPPKNTPSRAVALTPFAPLRVSGHFPGTLARRTLQCSPPAGLRPSVLRERYYLIFNYQKMGPIGPIGPMEPTGQAPATRLLSVYPAQKAKICRGFRGKRGKNYDGNACRPAKHRCATPPIARNRRTTKPRFGKSAAGFRGKRGKSHDGNACRPAKHRCATPPIAQSAHHQAEVRQICRGFRGKRGKRAELCWRIRARAGE